MEFTKKEPYMKQISLYVQNQEFNRAYALAQDFADKFKNELTAHFLLAKIAFRLQKFPEAIAAGRNAFNLAANKQDMLLCAVVLSAGYYMQGNTTEAYHVLNQVGGETNPDAHRLMFVYACTVKDPQKAMESLDRLYQINPRAADEFIRQFF